MKPILLRMVDAHRQPITSQLTTGWVVTAFLVTVLVATNLSETANRALFATWDPGSAAGMPAWLLAISLAWLLLALVLGAVDRGFGPGAARLSAFSVLAIALILAARAVLDERASSARLAGSRALDGPWAELALGTGLVGAALWWILLLVICSTELGARSWPLRSLAVGAAVIAAGSAVVGLTFPPGVNAVFAQEIWLPLLTLASFGALLVQLAGWTGDDRPGAASRSRIGLTDLLLLALPLVPILRYLLANRSEVPPETAMTLGAVFTVAVAVIVIGVPLALARLADRRMVQAVLSGWLFVLLNMASMSQALTWYGRGSLGPQVTALAATISLVLLLTLAGPRVLVWPVTLFLGLELVSGLPLEPAGSVAAASALAEAGDGSRPGTVRELRQRPDIALLVYDGYANRETLRAYGYDNEDQMAFLTDQGFTIYDGTYSVSHASLLTMSRVLEARTDLEADPRKVTAGDSYVRRWLDAAGYTTAGIFYSDYFLDRDVRTWDVRFPEASLRIRPLATGILQGELRAEASFNEVDREVFIETKRELLRAPSGDPQFLYVHGPRPGHSQNSGQCRPDETEQYLERIEVANTRMRRDVEAVNESGRDAIVVIAGDHGPYLTKNCTTLESYDAAEVTRLDLQDRYGTFLAIRWPETLVPQETITVLQDVFPLILSTLSGDPTFWSERQVDPVTVSEQTTAGATVDHGIIRGGPDDGEPLFLGP